MDLKNMYDKNGLDSTGSWQGPREDSCEHGTASEGSIRGRGFLNSQATISLSERTACPIELVEVSVPYLKLRYLVV
jgi:hypothetical protein